MKTCFGCKIEYPDDVSLCQKCQGTLVNIREGMPAKLHPNVGTIPIVCGEYELCVELNSLLESHNIDSKIVSYMSISFNAHYLFIDLANLDEAEKLMASDPRFSEHINYLLTRIRVMEGSLEEAVALREMLKQHDLTTLNVGVEFDDTSVQKVQVYIHRRDIEQIVNLMLADDEFKGKVRIVLPYEVELLRKESLDPKKAAKKGFLKRIFG